ncbi:hypothetical protein [Caudoviricetes sp.]|nr:hypothetical protein [Caudoviricetes sp.]
MPAFATGKRPASRRDCYLLAATCDLGRALLKGSLAATHYQAQFRQISN